MSEHFINLSSRLQLCASFVRPGAHLCDIGTDHAYLPIWLMQHKQVTSALACDVREGPLDCAKANIAKYRLQECIITRLSDGLSSVDETEADDFIVAGMGGELIARIITETAWLRNNQKQLILQPMTRPSHLRRAMADNGFALLKEKAVFDEHRAYTAMLYRYDPLHATLNAVGIYTGALSGKTAAEKDYLTRQSSYLKNRITGLLHTERQMEAATLQCVLDNIEERINQSEAGEST